MPWGFPEPGTFLCPSVARKYATSATETVVAVLPDVLLMQGGVDLWGEHLNRNHDAI
jgi:hypothetical protein